MLKRAIAILFCLALTACVLESKEPVVSDAQGELMLAGPNIRFEFYSKDNGIWKKGEETVSFTAENRHYLVSADDSNYTITFAPISASWWAMQVEEKDHRVNYLLAEARDGTLLLYLLSCEALLKSGKFSDFIVFTDSSCLVKDGVDALKMFKALAMEPGQPNMKLVPLP